MATVLPQPFTHDTRPGARDRDLHDWLRTALTWALVFGACLVSAVVGLSWFIWSTRHTREDVKIYLVEVDAHGVPRAVSGATSEDRLQTHLLTQPLTRFTELWFSRLHSTVTRDAGQVLYFLDEPLLEPELAARGRTDHWIEAFTKNPLADETVITVDNVSFGADMSSEPYTATVRFTKAIRRAGTLTPLTVTPSVVTLTFRLMPLDQLYTRKAWHPINPLGVLVRDFREDPNFRPNPTPTQDR